MVRTGWIVLLQGGTLRVDRPHFGSVLSADKAAAVVVIVAARAYVLLAPSGTTG